MIIMDMVSSMDRTGYGFKHGLLWIGFRAWIVIGMASCMNRNGYDFVHRSEWIYFLN